MDRLSCAAAALILCSVVMFTSCSRTPALPLLSKADSLRITLDNLDHRAEMDAFFAHDPHSPFVRDTSARYHGINWFPVDPAFCGRSVLHTYAEPETVLVMGTKGEARRQLRYGYVEFPVPGNGNYPVMLRMNVYKFTRYDGERYAQFPETMSIWFTDSTTGSETYEVGRYIDAGNDLHDPNHRYVIDLNKAYNPYCAYSVMYSCAIPRKEDRLEIALRVGEMKYHQ
jgi:uncharacterized protein (DUF1684 family)